MTNLFRLSPAILLPVVITVTSCSQPSTNQVEDLSEKPSETSEVVEKDQDQSDVDYLTTLGLMKGHLMVAQELIESGKPEEAEPHIGHPVEELYGDIESELPQRKVADFKSELNQFHDLVKTAPKSDKIKTEYDSSMVTIDQAIAAIPETKLQSPELILPVLNRLLETANAEYKAAIADGKIVELIEYQDSRGFVLYGDQLYQSIAQTMSQNHQEKHQVITATLEELKTAWPSVNAPKALVMTPEQVSELVMKIQKNSQL
ncbi:MAG TPA: hypothetical protein DCF68_04265 [Cyanothece sp. UBA12306]|nr:hypothetical protein [Cyanothece sp. UBA12306]